jgi:LEA14-like dessication related protein
MRNLKLDSCLLLLGCLLLAPLSGCVHMAGALGLIPEKPEIELADLKIESASFAKVEVTVVLNVTNRDHRVLRIDDLSFDLFFSENKLGSGAIREKLSVAANSSGQALVPLVLETKELVGAAMELMGGNPPEKMRISGVAHVRTWLGLIPVRFDRKVGSS